MARPPVAAVALTRPSIEQSAMRLIPPLLLARYRVGLGHHQPSKLCSFPWCVTYQIADFPGDRFTQSMDPAVVTPTRWVTTGAGTMAQSGRLPAGPRWPGGPAG